MMRRPSTWKPHFLHRACVPNWIHTQLATFFTPVYASHAVKHTARYVEYVNNARATHHTVPAVTSRSSSESSSLELSRVIMLKFLPPSEVQAASIGSTANAVADEDDTNRATPGRNPAPTDPSERHDRSAPLVHSASFFVKPSMLPTALCLPGDASTTAPTAFTGLPTTSASRLNSPHLDRGQRPTHSSFLRDAPQLSAVTDRNIMAYSFSASTLEDRFSSKRFLQGRLISPCSPGTS
jgi:hypothetical protein